MGLFDKLFGEFVDIIEWTDDTNNTMSIALSDMVMLSLIHI